MIAAILTKSAGGAAEVDGGEGGEGEGDSIRVTGMALSIDWVFMVSEWSYPNSQTCSTVIMSLQHGHSKASGGSIV